jgi:hypothetical protein
MVNRQNAIRAMTPTQSRELKNIGKKEPGGTAHARVRRG